jgi:anti-sigma factor RsiW
MDEKMLARMMQVLDGELSAEERSDLEGQIARCEDCSAEWSNLQTLDQMLRQEPMVHPPRGFTGRVVARIDQRQYRRRFLFGGAILSLGAVAAALLLVCLPLLSLPSVSGGLVPLFEAGRVSAVGFGEVAVTLLASLWVTADALILKALPLALCGFFLALVANLVWLVLIRKLHRTPERV